MSVRTYMLIGLVTAVLVYLIALVAGDSIIDLLVRLRGRAHPSAYGIASLVVEPIIFMLDNGVLGAAVTGVLWFIVPVFLLLVLFLLVLVALQGGFQSLESSDVLLTPLWYWF